MLALFPWCRRLPCGSAMQARRLHHGNRAKLLRNSMHVGTLRVRLLVREARTLKDKRQVLQSIKTRLRNQFNISVAEVEHQDHRQLAELGVAMIGPEVHAIKVTLGEIVQALRVHPVAEFLEHEIEV